MTTLYVVWGVIGFILTMMAFLHQEKDSHNPVPDFLIFIVSVVFGWVIGAVVLVWFLAKMSKKVLLPVGKFFVGMTK